MRSAALVVGAGPVGLTMAAELTRFGVTTRIVEKAAQRTDKSKALVLWARTLELLDRAGCGKTFVDAGSHVKAANIIAGKKQIAHFRLDEIKTAHPYALMLPQSDTERLLEEHLQHLGIQVERQTELLKFTPADDHVNATLRKASGEVETIQVGWMIGCDGAHSTVRHTLGMKFEGDTLSSNWILADVHLSGGSDNQNEVYTYWHSDGVLVIFPISPNRYRVVADVGDSPENQQPGHQLKDPTLQEVQAILDERGPGGIRVSDPIWLSAFRINERKVRDYRAGRIFVAGDSAHVHSPAGGQGMNTGMQDACNLAWKLAMVDRGLAAAEPLLESYSIERSAVGRQVLKEAGRLTRLGVLRGGVAQAIRNHTAALLFGLPPLRRTAAEQISELTIGYPHSPLTFAGHHPHLGPAPGERAPILDPTHLVGAGDTPRFALFAKTTAEAAALIDRYSDVLEPEPRPPIIDDYIWLVRPDGYVATVTRANECSEIDSYLAAIGCKQHHLSS